MWNELKKTWGIRPKNSNKPEVWKHVAKEKVNITVPRRTSIKTCVKAKEEQDEGLEPRSYNQKN